MQKLVVLILSFPTIYKNLQEINFVNTASFAKKCLDMICCQYLLNVESLT